MAKLKAIPQTELSSYVIDLLAKHEISTVREFLEAEINEICKITNINKLKMEEIRTLVRNLYKPGRIDLFSYYNTIKLRKVVYGFNIESCDQMLGQEKLASGSVFEIFGLAGIGKTQLCHTITLNIVDSHKIEALYLDTKQDFSSTRLFQMMRARNLDKVHCGHIMQRIKVEKALSLESVLTVLEKLQEGYEARNADVVGIKLVIIDALPALWFTLNGEVEHFERKYLIAKIANLIHKIAREHLVAFLVVNLAVQDDDLFISDNMVSQNINEENLNSISQSGRRRSTVDSISNEMSLRPSLGRFWISVPRVRLLLKIPEDADEDSSERLVEVSRSNFGPTGFSCSVYITEAGVIS